MASYPKNIIGKGKTNFGGNIVRNESMELYADIEKQRILDWKLKILKKVLQKL